MNKSQLGKILESIHEEVFESLEPQDLSFEAADVINLLSKMKNYRNLIQKFTVFSRNF